MFQKNILFIPIAMLLTGCSFLQMPVFPTTGTFTKEEGSCDGAVMLFNFKEDGIEIHNYDKHPIDRDHAIIGTLTKDYPKKSKDERYDLRYDIDPASLGPKVETAILKIDVKYVSENTLRLTVATLKFRDRAAKRTRNLGTFTNLYRCA